MSAARRGFPAFRTDRAASRGVTWWACALGYAVALGGIPLAAYLVLTLATATLGGTGVTRVPLLGPALLYAGYLLQLLQISFYASWMGALLSLPVVIWARAYGWFGWGTAMLTGIGVAIIALGSVYRFPVAEILVQFSLPSALLGFGFWLTVRLVRPGAFRFAPV